MAQHMRQYLNLIVLQQMVCTVLHAQLQLEAVIHVRVITRVVPRTRQAVAGSKRQNGLLGRVIYAPVKASVLSDWAIVLTGAFYDQDDARLFLVLRSPFTAAAPLSVIELPFL